MSWVTQVSTGLLSVFAYWAVTVFGYDFHRILLTYFLPYRGSFYPTRAVTRVVWAVPRSLATTYGIIVYFLLLWVLRCFSSPRWLTAWRYGHCWPGCPIRIFTGLGLFAPYRNFSQLITSFFASESLGILHAPLFTFFRVFRLSLEPATLGVDMGLLCSFTLLFPSCQGSFVENNGFEPLTPCLQSRCSSQLS